MNTIKAYSLCSPYFGKKTELPKPQEQYVFQPKKAIERENVFSFLTGALCVATIMSAIHFSNDADREFMIEQVEMQLRYSDPHNTKVQVKDVTGDDVADFVIEDQDGYQSIYDFKNKSLYYKEDEQIEQIY